jgi:hypothetical protein
MQKVMRIAQSIAVPLQLIIKLWSAAPHLGAFLYQTSRTQPFATHKIDIGVRDASGWQRQQGIMIIEDRRQKRLTRHQRLTARAINKGLCLWDKALARQCLKDMENLLGILFVSEELAKMPKRLDWAKP